MDRLRLQPIFIAEISIVRFVSCGIMVLCIVPGQLLCSWQPIASSAIQDFREGLDVGLNMAGPGMKANRPFRDLTALKKPIILRMGRKNL